MNSIDTIDQTIIRLLMNDGRLSIPGISEQIPNTTISLIRYRVNRLLEKGIIRLSTVVVPSMVGYPVTANVLLRVDTQSIKYVTDQLAALESISYVCNTLGNHDIGMTIHAHDNVELYTIVSNNISTLPGVKEISTNVVPLLLKDIYHWQIPDSIVPGLIPPRKPPYFPERFVPRTIDELDCQIINLLMQDALISAASISRKIEGISQRVISDRIESLIQNGVIRITAIVKPEILGFLVKADINIHAESKPLLDIARQLAELEQTSWVACAIGESHLSAQICVQDTQELYRFIFDVIHKIPGITRTETSLVVKVFKDSYDWHLPKSAFKESAMVGNYSNK